MTIRDPFGFLLLFLVYQAVTQGKNKLPQAQYISEPYFCFYRFGKHYIMITWAIVGYSTNALTRLSPWTPIGGNEGGGVSMSGVI